MKSLYESILSSTKTGGAAFVEKWCEEHIYKINGKIGYRILPNMKIVNNPQFFLYLKEIHEKIPSAIKFGDISGSFFIQNALNYMDASQLPSFVESLYINGKTGVIPSFKMKCYAFLVDGRTKDLKKIEPIVLEMEKAYHGIGRTPSIDLASTNIDIDSLKNITVKGYVNSIDIQDTPAADTIKKYFQKHRTKKLKSGDCPECKDFLDDIFGSYEGLEIIKLSARTTIRRHNKFNMWFLM